jgi:glycosyltransferase involved in cell wall biosynthesis
MKILIGHTHYQQAGGEDAVVRNEIALLRSNGHEVRLVEMSNEAFNALSWPAKFKNILNWHWSDKNFKLLQEECRRFQPDIAHFHNTFFMMTPSVYSACRSMGVPVVQTLHNFRLLCSNALFFRQGKVCEECQTSLLDRGIRYGCYRGSRFLTWAVVRMLKKHWRQKTWQDNIDAFIVLSDFARQKFITKGLSPDKCWLKPNFVLTDPGQRVEHQPYFVFAGRLSAEKGVKTLIDAFKKLPDVKLVVMGEGPLKDPSVPNIRWAGFLQGEEYIKTVKGACAVIVPSVCYENFPMAIAEAFACGVPVIASRLGSMQEIVKDGQTGVLFNAGDARDLAEKIQSLAIDPARIQQLGKAARDAYIKQYSAKANYEQLMSIYKHVM